MKQTNYPKYIKSYDGEIGVFAYLDFGEFPVYRFQSGCRVADYEELKSGSNNIENL